MEDNLINFESYFHGRMLEEDRKKFEHMLTIDSELKEEYNLYLSIKKGASDIERDNIRRQLDGFEITSNHEANGSKEKDSVKIVTLVKWVASIAALFIIGLWGYNLTQSPSPEQLFAKNFEIYEVQQSRGGGNPFPEINTNEINTSEKLLLYATMKIAEGQETEAIEYLGKISDDSTFRDEKYWYLGLANLKLGKLKEVKKHFNHLQKISNFNKTEIESILSELKL